MLVIEVDANNRPLQIATHLPFAQEVLEYVENARALGLPDDELGPDIEAKFDFLQYAEVMGETVVLCAV